MKASEHQLVGAMERPMKTSDSRINEIREHHFKLYTEEVLPLAVEQLELALKASPKDAQACDADKAVYWDMLKSIADVIAADSLIMPNGWTGFVDCMKCGLVPYLENFKGESVVSCPWCHSEGMKRANAARNRLSVCPEIELRELKELAK